MKVLLAVLLILLTACTTSYAQTTGPTPTPTPTPEPPAPSPSGIEFYGGLDKSDPYLSGNWDTPPSEVEEVALEITQVSPDGPVWNRRDGNRGRGWKWQKRNIEDRDTDKVWIFLETSQSNVREYQIWDDAGCDLSMSAFRITQDCKEWYDTLWDEKCDRSGSCPNLRKLPDLRPGSTFELRLFWCGSLGGNFTALSNRFTNGNCNGSDYYRLTIPFPPKPTPTPTPEPSETDMERMFQDNPALQEVWFRSNQAQRWYAYVRGDEDMRQLVWMVEGQPYWIVVSEETVVEGRRLFCCVNVITW